MERNAVVAFPAGAIRRAFVWSGVVGLMLVAGCSDPVTTDFISLVETGRQKEIARGARVRDFYDIKYDITRAANENEPHTAEVTVTSKSGNASTWKLAYEHRGGKWRFLRDKSRKFFPAQSEGQPLADEDPVWKQFITQELE
jgi:hypothetical protein